MMVKQTRHIFDLSDILAVRLQCKCGRELVQPLEEADLPMACPAPLCNERWVPDQSNTSDTAGLLSYVRKVLKRGDDRVTVRFEIDGEEEGG